MGIKLTFESNEMQKWNAPTDTHQRVDGKNGVICPATMFTLRAMAIKIAVNYKYQKISKTFESAKNIQKPCIFKGWHLINGGSEWKNLYNFLEELKKIFQMVFGLKKMSHFCHFNDDNSGRKREKLQ